jgi:signal transduction histidine kinase
MRLWAKLSLACSLVIAVVVVVGALSLGAMGRLVSVNRAITTRTVPAVRHASAVHDAMPGLARFEARMIVLGDPRYVERWNEQAAEARGDLARLEPLLAAGAEATVLREVKVAFDEYQRIVAEELELLRQGRRQQALRLSQTEGRALVERVEAAAERLIDAIHTGAFAAQAEAARLEAHTWTVVLVALAAALGLALLGTAVIAHRLTRSLRALSDATTALATGEFRPLPVEGRDEVAALARAFNAMAERLRELDELKEGFLATVSHELRSPLTSMREGAHLLRDEVAGDLTPKQGRLVTIIEEGSERLLRLVNQLLDLSRLRAGMLPLERKPLVLDRVVARAVDELRPQAEEAGIGLELECRGQRFDYAGDADRLVQVVVNLVANGIRFTPRGGRVSVRVVDAGPELEVQVEDTGVGIPPAALPHIFGWYEQAHRRKGGSGLGLPIVRGLVEAHGGRVTVESQEGKGSRFTVLLPRRGAES